MTTIICDLSVDWMECPYCSMLNGCVESAESTCRAASERLDQAYADYREERDAGRAEIGTGQWSVWQDRLRYLEQQSTAAHDAWGNAIDEWADCIHTHRRLYEEQQREAGAEPDRTDVSPETEEMSAVPDQEVHNFTDAPVAILHTTSHNQALRDWIEGLDHDNTPSDSTDHLTDAAHPTLHDTETDDLDGLHQAVQDMANGDTAAISLISIGRREMARDIRKALATIIYNIDHISTDLLSQEAHHA